jgi:hypothetical protein
MKKELSYEKGNNKNIIKVCVAIILILISLFFLKKEALYNYDYKEKLITIVANGYVNVKNYFIHSEPKVTNKYSGSKFFDD